MEAATNDDSEYKLNLESPCTYYEYGTFMYMYILLRVGNVECNRCQFPSILGCTFHAGECWGATAESAGFWAFHGERLPSVPGPRPLDGQERGAGAFLLELASCKWHLPPLAREGTARVAFRLESGRRRGGRSRHLDPKRPPFARLFPDQDPGLVRVTPVCDTSTACSLLEVPIASPITRRLETALASGSVPTGPARREDVETNAGRSRHGSTKSTYNSLSARSRARPS